MPTIPSSTCRSSRRRIPTATTTPPTTSSNSDSASSTTEQSSRRYGGTSSAPTSRLLAGRAHNESPALDEFLAAMLARRESATRPDDRSDGRRLLRRHERRPQRTCRSSKSSGAGSDHPRHTGLLGEQLPTDLLVAELAEAEGYALNEIWVTRKKGIAVQQRLRFESVSGSRETILLLDAPSSKSRATSQEPSAHEGTHRNSGPRPPLDC